MSTRQVGDTLEKKIFELFQAHIADGRFFASKECCKIYRKKGYFSKDREKNIEFDVAIEIFMPGSSDYSVLMLIECKNYAHPVPVDDAEEFFAKVQQVSGANVKGVIASTNSFQLGTLKYSRSKGIGLLRYVDENEVKWCLHRSVTAVGGLGNTLAPPEIETALVSASLVSSCHQFFFTMGEELGTSPRSLLRVLLTSFLPDRDALATVENRSPATPPEVKFIGRSEIDTCAAQVLRDVGYADGEVPLEEICRMLSVHHRLVVRKELPSDANGWRPGMLGRLSFEPLEITLFDDAGWNWARQRFTLAHELGHYFLGHSQYMSRESCDNADFAFALNPEGLHDGIRRMEWQANWFAASLLLPKDPLIEEFLELLRKHGLANRGFGALFVDEQTCNQANYYNITNALRVQYRVSRSVVRIRLEEFGLLNDARKGKGTNA